MRRLKSAERILMVQRQLQRMEERRLALVQQQEVAVDTDRREILQSLNEKEVLHGLFVFAMAKRLRKLDEETARLEVEKSVVARRLMEQGRRRKRAETLFDTVSDTWRREEDRRELLDTIEQASVAPKASLP
ncbi:MAG: hypothetical protein AB7S41_08130 [Parvibaculaceae bacterium]